MMMKQIQYVHMKTPAGNVDHYVTVKEHDQQFTRFSSSGEVHLWGGHSQVDACESTEAIQLPRYH
ncbi:hypothetical protein GCK32_003070 [Trichostrongylus colubriformis]|uniref:Uncharacterized protein n=1 Tax=Trichostrongylus colubriformis TaxID=6319 RepID=A0AAN8IEL6_TRICO